jgi:hypothetical protein
MPDYFPHPASFRDPSGFVFRCGANWYRQVNTGYRDDYLHLVQSGLYGELTAKGWLLPHTEIAENYTGSPDWYKTLLPEQLSFISYPEEWSPAQLKEAALCTLAISRLSIAHGMILKDATPRNIQFPEGRPVLIDSLSFERYDPSIPWVAYRQFCESFLYPLILHRYHGLGTHRLLAAWPDGIPAGAAGKMLPFRSRRSLAVWLHVLLPARINRSPKKDGRMAAFDQNKLLRLLANLEDIIGGLEVDRPGEKGWSDYYDKTILSHAYLREKERLFSSWIGEIEFSSALDLGANDGHFTRLLAEKNVRVIAAESDWRCVQTLHRTVAKDRPVHALCVDIANPTPATGFNHRERTAFSERAASDLVTALALLHHLVLGLNIPLPMIAGYLAGLTNAWLIIEFVPLTDEKSRQLVEHKRVYPAPYDGDSFEMHFAPWFTIERRAVIPGTERTLYLLRKKPP